MVSFLLWEEHNFKNQGKWDGAEKILIYIASNKEQNHLPSRAFCIPSLQDFKSLIPLMTCEEGISIWLLGSSWTSASLSLAGGASTCGSHRFLGVNYRTQITPLLHRLLLFLSRSLLSCNINQAYLQDETKQHFPSCVLSRAPAVALLVQPLTPPWNMPSHPVIWSQ